jgi:four helix bundle protein
LADDELAIGESNMALRGFHDLDVWRRGMELAESTYRITTGFPKHELYGLASQMQRAAVSIPSNIAEGNARESTREYIHHRSIAMGSAAELQTQLLLATRLGYVASDQSQALIVECDLLGKMLRSL